jgi:hypothetical protein
VEFDFGASGGVFPHEGVSLDEVHVVFVSQADVQDALVISGNNTRNVMRQLLFGQFVPPGNRNISAWTRTLDLGMTRQEFYHFATPPASKHYFGVTPQIS